MQRRDLIVRLIKSVQHGKKAAQKAFDTRRRVGKAQRHEQKARHSQKLAEQQALPVPVQALPLPIRIAPPGARVRAENAPCAEKGGDAGKDQAPVGEDRPGAKRYPALPAEHEACADLPHFGQTAREIVGKEEKRPEHRQPQGATEPQLARSFLL